jgi:hypothetical protein
LFANSFSSHVKVAFDLGGIHAGDLCDFLGAEVFEVNQREDDALLGAQPTHQRLDDGEEFVVLQLPFGVVVGNVLTEVLLFLGKCFERCLLLQPVV